MKDLGKEVIKQDKQGTFEQLKEILVEVAPLKVVDEITLQTSLVEDFAFDSIDIMGTLLKIQERFLGNSAMLELDTFLNETFGNEKRFTVDMICQQILNFLEKEKLEKANE